MKNKKVVAAIGILILIIGLGVVNFISNENAKTKPDNQYVTVKHKDASVGSILTVELSQDGKEKYSQADNYYVYAEDGIKELSIVLQKLGEETTVYPKVYPGDKIVVFLYDKDQKLIVKLDTKVIK